MKAITIDQPWASLVAVGAKRYLTMDKATAYRGRVAIHAGKGLYPFIDGYVGDVFLNALADALGKHRRYDTETETDCVSRITAHLPRGEVIATAELVECWEITHIGHVVNGSKATRVEAGICGGKTNIISGDELLFGDWAPRRYAWELADVKALDEPVAAKGRRGFWEWEGT